MLNEFPLELSVQGRKPVTAQAGDTVFVFSHERHRRVCLVHLSH